MLLLAQTTRFRQGRGVPAGKTQHINNLYMSLVCLWYQTQALLFVDDGRCHSDSTGF